MQTTFLFAMPSMLSGAARLLDFGGWFDSYNTSETPEIADAIAIYSDFRIVGQDLQKAMDSASLIQNPADGLSQLEFAFVKEIDNAF